jgi:hypothetical protein
MRIDMPVNKNKDVFPGLRSELADLSDEQAREVSEKIAEEFDEVGKALSEGYVQGLKSQGPSPTGTLGISLPIKTDPNVPEGEVLVTGQVDSKLDGVYKITSSSATGVDWTEIATPTQNLRQIRRKLWGGAMGSTLVLQQQWSIEAGANSRLEWRDVPVVDEEEEEDG